MIHWTGFVQVGADGMLDVVPLLHRFKEKIPRAGLAPRLILAYLCNSARRCRISEPKMQTKNQNQIPSVILLF